MASTRKANSFVSLKLWILCTLTDKCIEGVTIFARGLDCRCGDQGIVTTLSSPEYTSLRLWCRSERLFPAVIGTELHRGIETSIVCILYLDVGRLDGYPSRARWQTPLHGSCMEALAGRSKSQWQGRFTN